jgi:hypothetical protein
MASPLAMGVLAAVLAEDQSFRVMPADEQRSAYALEQLQMQCLPLSLKADCQGNGLIMLDLAAWGLN